MSEKVKTAYRIAWDRYLLSNDYIHAEQAMKEKGMIQPYINNILQLAFNAGYNSK